MMNVARISAIIVFALAVGITLTAASFHADATAAQTNDAKFTKFVTENYMTPEEYVAGKFKEYDVVFIGESHHHGQNLEFLHNLLAKLYDAGVYNLCFEFALYENQDRLDNLVTADEYDEDLARELNYHRYAEGYQEYADVFKAAWKVNKKAPKGGRVFRVIGLNLIDGTHLCPEGVSAAEMNPIRDKYLGGHRRDIINRAWADVIVKEIIAKGEKAVVYLGSGHANTAFRLDRTPLTKHFTSTGNFIYNYIPERTTTLIMHGAFAPPSKEEAESFLGSIEEKMSQVPDEYRRVGMDTKGTPLGEIAVPGVKGYYEGRCGDFKLRDVVEGYIYLCSMAEWKPDTPYTQKGQ